MAITEGDRHRLHQRLEALMGEEEAATLMEHLPPVGWADVATKTDLDHLRAAIKADIDQLQAATKADIDQLRAATKTDIDHLREMTDARFEHVQTVMALQFEQTATKAELHKVMRTHTMFLIGTNIAVVGLVAAVFAR